MLYQVRAGRRSWGSAAPLTTPFPPLPTVSSICSLTASFNRMTPDTQLSLGFSCQRPQTLCSRRQPSLSAWPSEAGVQAKRHFVRGRTVHCNLCCGFSGQGQMEQRVFCLLSLFLPFITFCVTSASSLPPVFIFPFPF